MAGLRSQQDSRANEKNSTIVVEKIFFEHIRDYKS